MEKLSHDKMGNHILGKNDSVAGNAFTKEACHELLKYNRIAEAAYLIAERKNFTAGHEVDDWLDKEAELTKRLHNVLRN